MSMLRSSGNGNGRDSNLELCFAISSLILDSRKLLFYISVSLIVFLFIVIGRDRVCLVIVFCFCSKKLIFVLFLNFGFKYGFLQFSIYFFFVW